MTGEPTSADHIQVGNITGSQGIAIGRDAQAVVVGNSSAREMRIDSTALRSALEQLYESVGDVGLPRDKKIVAQTATGTALEGVRDDEVDSASVTSGLQKVGDTLTQANVAIEQGTSLWENLQKLASLVGPLVGGAGVVGGWFGIPLL